MRQQPRMPAGESGNREPDVCCKGIFPFKFMMNDNAKWLSVLTANGVVLVPACGGRSLQDDVLSAERPNPFSGVASAAYRSRTTCGYCTALCRSWRGCYCNACRRNHADRKSNSHHSRILPFRYLVVGGHPWLTASGAQA